MQSSNVYSKLGERLGLVDHQAVLTLMLQPSLPCTHAGAPILLLHLLNAFGTLFAAAAAAA
jgi:hypothetical protein